MDKNTQFLARTLLAYMAGVMIGFSAFLVAACMITGCCTTEERAAAIQAAKEIAQEVSEVVAQAKAAQEPAQVRQAAEPEPVPEVQEPAQAPAVEADEEDFNALDWCWGGFGGGGATPAEGCRISNLRVGGGKLSYDWADGSCAPLGEESRGDAVCIAALFCLGEDGKWRGGKFEWIGTSRTSRSLGNCDGYHGWQMSAVDAAQAYAFVIVSKDGRRRSNVIRKGN